MMTKRLLLTCGTSGLSPAVGSPWSATVSHAAETFAMSHSDAEWRKLLTPDQYAVLRQSATERPHSSPLLHGQRRATFACAGCDLDLFSSTTKSESRTGWPSFRAALDKSLGTASHTSFGMERTAVHCARCGGHLGHLFDDGPRPTGLRFCMNGVAMTFKPATA